MVPQFIIIHLRSHSSLNFCVQFICLEGIRIPLNNSCTKTKLLAEVFLVREGSGQLDRFFPRNSRREAIPALRNCHFADETVAVSRRR